MATFSSSGLSNNQNFSCNGTVPWRIKRSVVLFELRAQSIGLGCSIVENLWLCPHFVWGLISVLEKNANILFDL